jgi:antitoxin VapB
MLLSLDIAKVQPIAFSWIQHFAFRRLSNSALIKGSCLIAIVGICLRHMHGDHRMPTQRHVKLFRNGRNQAVRIPVEFELPGDEAIMHRDGDRLVIEPVRKRGVLALLETMKPLDEDFPEIGDRPPAAENVF